MACLRGAKSGAVRTLRAPLREPRLRRHSNCAAKSFAPSGCSMLSESSGVASDRFDGVSPSSPSARSTSDGSPARASIQRKADSSDGAAQSLRPSAVQISHGANVMLSGRYRMMRTAPVTSTRQTCGAISLTAKSITLPLNACSREISLTCVSAPLMLIEHMLA
jgi:hypothetical protein